MNSAQRLKHDGAVDPVLFYKPKDLYGEFSNFSRHGLYLPDPWVDHIELRYYPTGEHRYQAMKATDSVNHDYVLEAPGPTEAKDRGRTIPLRDDWGDTRNAFCWQVMVEVCMTKALQNADVLELLESTKNRWIYEDSPTDDIWGWRYRYSHNGKNLLGRCWMHVRAILCS